jgi:hypothetical protein
MLPFAMPSLRAPVAFLGLAGCLSACAVGVADFSADAQPAMGETDAGGDAAAAPTDSGGLGTGDTGAGHADGRASADTGVGPGMDSGRGVETGADTGNVGCGFSGVLVTFDLSQESGNEASVTPASTAAGVSVGPLKRSSALSSVSGSGSINASGWATAASLDPARYYTFTVTPPAGCAATFTTLSVDSRASATGPSTAAAGTSADNFASPVTFSPGGVSSVAVTGAAGATGAIEVRIFGYAAGSTGGTLRIASTLTLSGSLH